MSIPSSSSSTSLPRFPSLPSLPRRPSLPSLAPDASATAALDPRPLDDGLVSDQRPDLRIPPTRKRAVAHPRWDVRRGSLVLVLVLSLIAALAVAWRLHHREADVLDRTAGEVLALVEQHYRTIEHLSADLRLTVTNLALERAAALQRDGRISLQRGGKLRWDAFQRGAVASPPRIDRSLISDGEQLFLVDFGGKEIVKLHRPDDPMVLATSFLFASSLTERFTAELVPPERYRDGASDGDHAIRHALVLTPRAPDPRLERLVLLVDSRWLVRQLILETAHNRQRFAFSSQDPRTPPKQTWFELDREHPALDGFRLVDAGL
jgi:outer membrane lipoprotein-sorting protein